MKRDDRGFTLIEVMIALLIGMIGLLGTVAIQQTMLRATANANEASVAMRLAMQKLEELNALTTTPGPPVVDELALIERDAVCGNANVAAAAGGPECMVTCGPPANEWCVDFVDADGGTTSATETPTFRFRREWQVVNLNNPAVVPALPYNITVKVIYGLDIPDPDGTGPAGPRTIQLDSERQKQW